MDSNDNTYNQENSIGLPSEEQLTFLLENLFERSRLVELAYRCSNWDSSLDLRVCNIRALVEILVQAWSAGPRSHRGSLWGTVDLELVIRLRGYLGQGEARLRGMLEAQLAEGGYDRKTSAILLWTLLHERRLGLLEEFDSALRNSYRDTGQTLVAEMAEVADSATSAENTSEQAMQMERLEDLGREIKALVNAQSRQIEAIARRLDTVEGNFSQPPAARMTVDRRMQKIPNEQIRVGVFVDVQNMFYAAKKLDGARLNYAVMLDAILKGRRLIKAVAYIVESSDVDQSGFISVLEKKGYLVRRKELKSFMDGTAKGDWDMGMAIDMIEMAEQLDVIVLVSGDGDFVSLVRLIQKTGPRVELYAFGHNLSTELREVSDQFYEITSDLLLKNHYQATSTAADSGNGKAAGEQKDSSAGPPEQEGSGQ